MSDATRAERLLALVRDAGIGTGASCVGAHDDIAVIHGAHPDEVRAHAEQIRALGFRHVTVDLGTLARGRAD